MAKRPAGVVGLMCSKSSHIFLEGKGWPELNDLSVGWMWMSEKQGMECITKLFSKVSIYFLNIKAEKNKKL
jgi:hypothetical protein